MAEKKPEDNSKSLQDTASSNANRSSRLETQHRQQDQNNSLFAQLFAGLQLEQQKLRDLEQRRSKLTEELRNLKALLFAENQKLKQSVSPVPGNPIPSGKFTARTLPENASTSRTAPSIVKSIALERRASSKSVKIAEPPSQSFTIRERPRASSNRSLQKRGNRKGLKASKPKTKQRTPLGNKSNAREDMLGMADEITSVGCNLQTLEHRRSDREDREDIEEVLISLPALFTFLDAQTESQESDPSSDTGEAPQSSITSDQDPNFYLPSAISLFDNLLGCDATPPALTLDLPLVGISECSAIVAEVISNATETGNDLELTTT
ncbi:uncharacterized protein LOC108149961 [Drosophila elegans]|uniref:uncharacterized protein LOC108149961 n=1 Tax=Drosophila elegans TaxID=30023 RepID=UPI0007E812FA|nr:uncharacterized protein LOC108149961 [Drosophila elegans]